MKTPLLFISTVFLFAYCNSQTKPENSTKVQHALDSGNTGPAYLPKPHDTKSSVNLSKVLGWHAAAAPKAPQGFTVTPYGKDYKNPRWIYELPNGDVLVAETKK